MKVNKIIIRQSYHGKGNKEGYRYKIYNENKKKLGQLIDLPHLFYIDKTVKLFNKIWIITNYYDSFCLKDDKTEVVYYELEPFKFIPNFDLDVLLKEEK